MTAKDILDLARSQIGTTASNIKRCKYNTWFYGYEASGDSYDWCAVFISWLFAQKNALGLIGGKNANCGYLAKQFEQKGKLIKPKNMFAGFSSSDVKPRDVVFYHWGTTASTLLPGTYVSDHVGIVESVGSGNITAIEGNTGSNPNGAVLRQIRPVSSISCIGRPDYEGGSASTSTSTKQEGSVVITLKILANGSSGAQVKTLQRLLNAEGYRGKDGKALTVDSKFGANTDYAVRKYQTDKKLTVDGEVGTNTWKKLLGVS